MSESISRRNLLKIGGGAGVASLAGVTLLPGEARADSWTNELVKPGADGRLVYAPDGRGKVIPDFSWAGYRNGAEKLPDVPVVTKIGPIKGETDSTARIQAALDDVGARKPDANGFRGALLLKAGNYPVGGVLKMKRSGVVLRGEGQWEDPSANTVITGTAGVRNTVLWVDGAAGDWDSAELAGPRTDVTSTLVKAGQRRLTVGSTANLKVGDNIIIVHPDTPTWRDAINNGGVKDKPSWEAGKYPIMYNRYIQEIDGNDIVICAPVFNDLRHSLSKSYVYAWDQTGLVRNVGIENLRIDMAHQGPYDETHPESCIVISRAEDVWVKDASLLHFSKSAVWVQRSTRVTVQGARAMEPRSRVVGGKRYSFCAAGDAQQILFRDLEANDARHAFIATGTTTCSGNVWLNGSSVNGRNESGGHHRWSQGLLYDNIKELSNQSDNLWALGLHNRGDKGDGHGWSSVNSVAWNCTVDSGRQLCVQAPPTAQNFAIGTQGIVTGENWYTHTKGYEDGTNELGLDPSSLYLAQLRDRLTAS
ncbi:hypothetical protein GCM10009745_02180 [Kribbella yunnanensis]|uniref:Peptidoglycan-binding protein n=1 Tax=Kribbella yunnanensis TaxID=190194 RepID=A0ABP4RXS9_9ACTN